MSLTQPLRLRPDYPKKSPALPGMESDSEDEDMDRYASKSLSDKEKQEIYKKWKKLINMSASELKSWAKNPDRLKASLNREEADDQGDIQSGYDSLHRIKRRVSEPVSEWSDQDFKNAKQEIGFNSRMLGNKPGKPVGDTGRSKWEISLRNWGHDPGKKSSPAYSKYQTWKKKHKGSTKTARLAVKVAARYLFERIPGGLSSGKAPWQFDPEDLARGIRVEMEHTNDPMIAREIAMDHLTEHENYYDALAVMENYLETGQHPCQSGGPCMCGGTCKCNFKPRKLKASRNVPMNPKLWEKVQAVTKGEKKSFKHNGKVIEGPNDGQGFKIFPSAYANGFAVRLYNKLGGGWKKEKLFKMAIRNKRKDKGKNVGHGGLDEWFSGHGGKGKGSQWGDWISISPVERTVTLDGKKKKIKPGDIVGPCGISKKPEWKEFTNNGKDPLKCMPRAKAQELSREERADLARKKQRAEAQDSDKSKSPTRTETIKKARVYGYDITSWRENVEDHLKYLTRHPVEHKDVMRHPVVQCDVNPFRTARVPPSQVPRDLMDDCPVKISVIRQHRKGAGVMILFWQAPWSKRVLHAICQGMRCDTPEWGVEYQDQISFQQACNLLFRKITQLVKVLRGLQNPLQKWLASKRQPSSAVQTLPEQWGPPQSTLDEGLRRTLIEYPDSDPTWDESTPQTLPERNTWKERVANDGLALVAGNFDGYAMETRKPVKVRVFPSFTLTNRGKMAGDRYTFRKPRKSKSAEPIWFTLKRPLIIDWYQGLPAKTRYKPPWMDAIRDLYGRRGVALASILAYRYKIDSVITVKDGMPFSLYDLRPYIGGEVLMPEELYRREQREKFDLYFSDIAKSVTVEKSDEVDFTSQQIFGRELSDTELVGLLGAATFRDAVLTVSVESDLDGETLIGRVQDPVLATLTTTVFREDDEIRVYRREMEVPQDYPPGFLSRQLYSQALMCASLDVASIRQTASRDDESHLIWGLLGFDAPVSELFYDSDQRLDRALPALAGDRTLPAYLSAIPIDQIRMHDLMMNPGVVDFWKSRGATWEAAFNTRPTPSGKHAHSLAILEGYVKARAALQKQDAEGWLKRAYYLSDEASQALAKVWRAFFQHRMRELGFVE